MKQLVHQSDVNSMHSAACQLWKAGFSVVPLYPRQKRPALAAWGHYKEKRCALSEINQWWSAGSKQLFGIGVVTGAVSRDVVLDFDPTAWSTAEQLQKEAEDYFGQKFPVTCRVRTASGGWHDHYTTDKPVSTRVLFSGKHGRIELRGEGSIVVMPPTAVPSKHGSASDPPSTYAYLRGLDQRVPWESTWMAALDNQPETRAAGSRPSEQEIHNTLQSVKPTLPPSVIKALEGKAPTRDRSAHSYWLACELVRAGHRSLRTVATVIMASPYHQEKYGKRRGSWDAWQDACSCAAKALESAVSATEDKNQNTVKVVKVNLSEIQPGTPRFLIRPYLPRGEITLLDGDPGIGKSWVWMALVAGLTGSTVCTVPYDHTATKDARVLILTTEDDPSRTLAKRFDELGADRTKITLLGKANNVGHVDHRQILPVTAADLEEARPIIAAERPDLIVVDPIVLYATTDSEFDGDKAVKVRHLLLGLKELAVNLDCAVLVVRHFRKQSSTKAIYRGMGSIDYAATARSVLVVAKDKKSGRRAMSHAKSNLDVEGPTVFFTLNSNDYPPFKWDEISEETKADSLTDETTSSSGDDGQLLIDEAKSFLLEILASGPVPARQIVKEAASMRFSEKTLYKAKAQLGVLSKRHGFGRDASYTWLLPRHA